MYLILTGPPRGSTRDLRKLAESLSGPALMNEEDKRGSPERLSSGNECINATSMWPFRALDILDSVDLRLQRVGPHPWHFAKGSGMVLHLHINVHF